MIYIRGRSTLYLPIRPPWRIDLKITHITSCALVSALTLGVAQTSDAALLSVDFGTSANNVVESGFVGQNGTPATHGSITVTSTGQQGFFDRLASGGTNNALYRDFIFDNNSNGFTLTLSGAGIAASTDYVLTFYAFDKFDGSRATTINGTAGTTGPALGPVSGTTDPSSLDDYAVSGTYTSDVSGNLTFALTGPRTVLNGFVLDVPEPSSLFALLGLGGLLIAPRRRG